MANKSKISFLRAGRHVIYFAFLLITSCIEKLPTAPTVINGIVVDENENPIPNFMLDFYGVDNQLLRGGWDTFLHQALTDSNGMFSFSQVIPNETDVSEIILNGVRDINRITRRIDDFDYAFYLDDQFIMIPREAIFRIHEEEYGRTLEIRIKRLKRPIH